MSYDKLSMKSFKESLATGKYNSAAGARRAVGKALTLSSAEKDQARKLIDAKFGAATIKAAPKKPVVKKHAKPGPKPKAARHVPTSTEVASSIEAIPSLGDAANLETISGKLALVERVGSLVNSHLANLTSAKMANLAVDETLVAHLESVISDGVGILTGIYAAYNAASAPASAPRVEEAEDLPVPNGVHTRAESLFRDSLPAE